MTGQLEAEKTPCFTAHESSCRWPSYPLRSEGRTRDKKERGSGDTRRGARKETRVSGDRFERNT